MKIRFKVNISGTVHELPDGVSPGDEIEVSDEDAARYCRLRYADPVVDTGEEHAKPPKGEERDESAPPAKRPPGRPAKKTA